MVLNGMDELKEPWEFTGTSGLVTTVDTDKLGSGAYGVVYKGF